MNQAGASDPSGPMGERVSDLTMLRTGAPLDPSRNYMVVRWASVNEGTEEPPVYDVVSRYIERRKTVSVAREPAIRVLGA